MPVAELLRRLRQVGVQLRADGDTLRFDAPAGAMTDDLRTRIRYHKAELLAILQSAAPKNGEVDELAPMPSPDLAVRQERSKPKLRSLRPAVEEFRRNADGVGLTMLLRAFGSSGVRGSDIAAILPRCPPRLVTAVELLLLSRPVRVVDARALLSGGLADHLVAEGLAEAGDDWFVLPLLRVVEHLGRLLFVGAKPAVGSARFGYYGTPSVGLGRLLLGAVDRHSGGRCLDYFSSTCAQAAVMGLVAREVIAVECEASLAPVIDLNLALSGMVDIADVRWGDATKIDLDGPFDLVSVSPPILPSFGLRLPWQTNGGPDGCRILEAALRHVDLTPAGELFSIAHLLGDETGGPRTQWLRQLAEDRSWSVTVIQTGYTPLDSASIASRNLAETFAMRGAGSTAEVLAELVDVWRSTNVTRMFRCLLRVSPAMEPEVVHIATGDSAAGGWWL